MTDETYMQGAVAPGEIYTLAEIRKMTPVHVGQFDDLLFDTGETRIWFSRMTTEDGAPYNNQVTIEELQDNGHWVTVGSYRAR